MRELLGVDFSSAPSARKPIVAARGHFDSGTLHLQTFERCTTLAAFEALLAARGPWFGAFDFPFGLPREFVAAHGLGDSTAAVIAELRRRCASRMAFRALVDAWGNGRPAGQRLIHRATDRAHAAMSSSPLQTRYVPVGFMYYEGLARLIDAGVTLPAMHAGDPQRIAVEGYPARLAFDLIGRRSYKNADDGDRRDAREAMLSALARPRRVQGLDVRLQIGAADRRAIVADASGDLLDAVLCLVQAAAAAARPDHGVPAGIDGVEGWIVGSDERP
jgi:hypothetical protein